LVRREGLVSTKRLFLVLMIKEIIQLCAKSVEGSALSLESVDDVHSGDGLSSGVLGVGDGVSDDSLEEVLQDLSGVLVDEVRDSLDSTSSGESSDGGFGDALQQWSGALSSASLGSNLSDSLSDSLA
jgi:hypothetical protein